MRTAGDADLDCGFIGRLGAKASGCDVAEEISVSVFSDEHTITLAVGVFGKPSNSLLGSKRVNVEGNVGVFDVMVLNFCQAWQIV